MIALWVVSSQSRRRPSELIAFVGGALPFVVLVVFYHNISFGGPFELSYHHLANASLDACHTEGVGGVFLPGWEATYGSLFSFHRGLLITAPIFIFVLLGIQPMAERIGRHAALMLSAILLYFVIFIFSSNTWFAGWSYGPRLLVSTLSIAAIPLAFGLEKAQENIVMGSIALATFAVGLISNLLMKLTFFEVPPSSTNPLMDVALPMIVSQTSPPSLLTTMGVSWEISIAIAVLAAMTLLLITAWRYSADGHPQLSIWATALVFVFGSIIYSQGPSWDEDQSDRFEALLGASDRDRLTRQMLSHSSMISSQ